MIIPHFNDLLNVTELVKRRAGIWNNLSGCRVSLWDLHATASLCSVVIFINMVMISTTERGPFTPLDPSQLHSTSLSTCLFLPISPTSQPKFSLFLLYGARSVCQASVCLCLSSCKPQIKY